ncbi:MAG: N-formylglutamate amidohydrolase, partial [Gammaproteobacteria bacterium]
GGAPGALWLEQTGTGPFVATAIHAGHEVRREVLPLIAIDAAVRAREEDPYTDYWVKAVPTWLVPTRSRFEVDLNRPRERAVYTEPEMAWDLHLWRIWCKSLPEDLIERSLREYDAFYAELERVLERLLRHHRRLLVLDLHAYNYRREGPHAPPADPKLNPDVNVGTGNLDRRRWAGVIERFIADLRAFNYLGRSLDVRENVKFKGRELGRWIAERFAGDVGVLSVEFKKSYMDEWTGVGNIEHIQAIRDALHTTLPGLLEELERVR